MRESNGKRSVCEGQRTSASENEWVRERECERGVERLVGERDADAASAAFG